MSDSCLQMPAEMPWFSILGVNVSAIDLPTATQTILAWVADRRSGYVTITGVHGVMEARDSPEFRRVLRGARMVTPDGMPLVYYGRVRRHQVSRVYGPDLMLALMEATRDGTIRHYFYGGGEGVADRLRDRLSRRFPGIAVAGTMTPPFRPLSEHEEEETAAAINASRADIVWIGLSTPKQEYWMARMCDRLDAPILIGVGAAFDFNAGLKSQAPRILQILALEWLYRLATEPRRLWRRYLRNNPRFLLLIAGEFLLGRRYFQLQDKDMDDDSPPTSGRGQQPSAVAARSLPSGPPAGR
ncbi:WecB/TagA/CpsF family glycosyltransferase (plasmid) [Skermanella rosea]|uniref:WecB/TagA/CpsF family glycosyltransferase n=1 Tax=Skermanella rosea TaxID=1817965 RepID=UPI001933076F|nr:WecB/TagA/CpsF family glycosyltransferase [Skermanella rosea]UEM07343.1 WecB/TagA/CpsF family glycosyltransferase [Skermanella rosea]